MTKTKVMQLLLILFINGSNASQLFSNSSLFQYDNLVLFRQGDYASITCLPKENLPLNIIHVQWYYIVYNVSTGQYQEHFLQNGTDNNDDGTLYIINVSVYDTGAYFCIIKYEEEHEESVVTITETHVNIIEGTKVYKMRNYSLYLI